MKAGTNQICATANAKGQVVIPASVRRLLGITEGTRIRIEVDETHQGIILTPITRSYLHRLRGRYKGQHLISALVAEKAQEREL